MKTNFKEVAHLYIGCNLVKSDLRVVKFIGIATRSELQVYYSGDLGSGFIAYSHISPLLRPLSSITIIEALELGKIVSNGVLENVSEIHRTYNDVTDRAQIFYSNSTEKIDLMDQSISWLEQTHSAWVELPICNYGRMVLYLTSNGFDIFGLIKQGEAIKK